MERDRSSKSEYDILNLIAEGGLGEIRGLRSDVKGFLQNQGLPAQKSPAEREVRKQGYRTAPEADKELEILGRRLFFGEDIPLPSEQKPKPPPPPVAVTRVFE